jgi:hypothetical protein
MKKEFPKPETQLNVLRRYLHVLALLHNKKDPEDWNASSLADLLSLEETGEPLTDKTIRDYIRKNLADELGLRIEKKRGGRRTLLADFLEEDMLRRVALVYSSFVITDTARDLVLERLIKKHPLDCLWLLARMHFAIVERKKMRFEYTPNTARQPYCYTVHPYHLVFRNNNLYFVGKNEYNGVLSLFIVNKIDRLEVLAEHFDEDVPSLSDIFADTLGSFIGKRYNVRIRFKRKVLSMIEQVISILEPEIIEVEKDEAYEARFTCSDDLYLCKQLFLYGKEVEILEPKELRETMMRMLSETLGVYGA